MTKEKKKTKLSGLALLRSPFPDNQISKLARRGCTKEQWNDAKKATCTICATYHSTAYAIHLDYVGHAALTDRLLECDPEWKWEPFAKDEKGLPSFSKDGLWINLTVCGVTRMGFGSADGKIGGDAVKEIIGDALRNAAMRFGAALDLWHKGELHVDEDQDGEADENIQIEKKHDWHGPMRKEKLTQTLIDLAAELKKLTPKDTLGFLDGLWTDNIAALEQAEHDVPRWYAKVVEAKKVAEIRIGSFPGDEDPFDLPPLEGDFTE